MTILSALDEGILVFDASGRVVRGNQAASAIFQLPADRPFHTFRRLTFFWPDGSPVSIEDNPIHRVLTTGEDQQAVIMGCRLLDGSIIWFSLNARLLPGEAGGCVSSLNDITERFTAARQEGAKLEATTIIAGSTSLADAAPRLLGAIGRNLNWHFGTFWRLAEEGRLHPIAVWTNGSSDYSALEAETRGMTLGGGEGIAGSVLMMGGPFWTNTITPAARVPRSQAAFEAGFKSAFAFPITNSRGVVGVIDFLVSYRAQSDAPLRSSLSRLGSQIGQFIQRIEAQEALAESEERFRLLAENATDMISRSTPEGILTYISPAIEPILGITAEQALGVNLFEGVHRDDLEALLAANARTVAGESPVVGLYRRRNIVTREWRWLEASSRRIDDPNTGECNGILSVTRDVTERKITEDALRDSEEAIRAIIEASPDSIVIIGTDWTFKFLSPSFLRVLGYSQAEFGDRLTTDIVHPDDRLGVVTELQRIIDEGPGATTEVRFRVQHRNGTLVTIEAHARTLAKETSGVVVIFRDVTIREQAAEDLRRSEERYRNLFENATDVIFTLDLAGQFTSANHAVEQTTGYTEAQLLTMNVAQVIAPDHLQVALDMRREALKTGHSKGVNELDLVTSDGSRVPLEIRLRAVGPAGTYVGLQGMARDLTARRHAEELLRTVAAYAPIGMYIAVGGRFAYVNPQFCRDTAYSADDLLDTRGLDMVLPEYREDARLRAIAMLKGDHSTPSEFQIRTADGQSRWFMETVNSISYRGQRAALGSIVDLTDRKRAEAQLTRMAFFDELTGLPNRAQFMDRLEDALALPQQEGALAILFMDLDGFKQVNDSFGHACGDDLLARIAKRLTTCLRPTDIVARLGGDEFTVLLQGIKDPIEAHAVARRVIETLRTPFQLEDSQLKISVSIGIAFNRSNSSPGDILREADIALYRAKATHQGDFVVFDRAAIEKAA
ncbi:MAG: PAS domain S-box protein [Dehalococcoidia bacterium]